MPQSSESPEAPSESFIRELTQNQQAVRGYIFASLGGCAEADDVVQKTNLVLWRKSSDWDPQTNFLTWAIAVAHFEVLAFYRDSARDRLLFEPDVVEEMTKAAEEQTSSVANTGRGVALADCLRTMKPEHQNLLNRRYAQGYSIKEIGETQNRSSDSVKSLLLRLRKLLRQCIEQRLETEVPA